MSRDVRIFETRIKIAEKRPAKEGTIFDLAKPYGDGVLDLLQVAYENVKSAKVNETEDYQQAPPQASARAQLIDHLKKINRESLLDNIKECDVNEPVEPTKNRLIHLAAYFGDFDLARILVIERKAQLDIRNSTNNTALYIASNGGHTSIVKLLLERGADSTIAGRCYWLPLHIAVDRNHPDIVKLLLDYTTDISVFERPVSAYQGTASYTLCALAHRWGSPLTDIVRNAYERLKFRSVPAAASSSSNMSILNNSVTNNHYNESTRVENVNSEATIFIPDDEIEDLTQRPMAEKNKRKCTTSEQIASRKRLHQLCKNGTAHDFKEIDELLPPSPC